MWTVHRTLRPRPSPDSIPVSDLNGEVDLAAKRIFLHPDLTGEHLAEIVIHELLHIFLTEWEELNIDSAAKDITRLLKRLNVLVKANPPEQPI